MIWATAIPYPLPPYTPTMPLRASTMAPIQSGDPGETASSSANLTGSKIAFIVAAIMFSILTCLALFFFARKRNRSRTVKGGPGGGVRFRVPKFPNVHGRVARGIECLSWKMENGSPGSSGEITIANDSDDKTWGALKCTKTPHCGDIDDDRTPIIASERCFSASSNAETLPWPMPTHRVSCPPSINAYIRDLNVSNGHGETLTISVSASPNLSRVSTVRAGFSTLETIGEEPFDFFVGQYLSREETISDDLVNVFSLRNRVDSPNFPEDLADVDTEIDTLSTLNNLTTAGMRSAAKRTGPTRNRVRQGSDASRTTNASTATNTDSFSDDGQSGASSSTSLETMISDIGDDEESDTSGSDEEVFELKRVTNSMEVKKGVLMALAKAQASDTLPEMPELAISHQMESGEKSAVRSEQNTDHREAKHPVANLLHPNMITHSSSASVKSLQSSCSGASVDLNDFPTPPACPINPAITFMLSSDTGLVTLLD